MWRSQGRARYSIRRSPRAFRLLLRTALEHGTAGGAKVATVMGHARPDTANVGDVLLAEPHRVRFAGRALPRGPFLRGGGPRPEREREAQERRRGYDRPEVWLGGTNVGAPLSHFRSLVRDPLKTITHAAWACTDWCPELADREKTLSCLSAT